MDKCEIYDIGALCLRLVAAEFLTDCSPREMLYKSRGKCKIRPLVSIPLLWPDSITSYFRNPRIKNPCCDSLIYILDNPVYNSNIHS